MQRYFSRTVSGAAADIGRESLAAAAEMEQLLTLVP
jgi:hypothetical protein